MELNLDGLVGTTHHYAGLARGNLASQRHAGLPSSPRTAALQGLAKLRVAHDAGLVQAVLPPHERPDLEALRRLGFTGDDAAVLHRAAHDAPRLLAACASASSMWAANAATVSPSPDSADRRAHLTPANLAGHLHRSLEAPFTHALLRLVFADPQHFAIHAPLPATPAFHDEGAANHLRFAPAHDEPGLEVFVFGHHGDPSELTPGHPTRHPARQSRLASEAVARLHGVRHALFLRQHPLAIEAGVFHNDVASVAHLDTLFAHELCFERGERDCDEVRAGFLQATGRPLRTVIVPQRRVPITDAVASYLFNSQVVGDDPRALSLICPSECREIASVSDWLDEQLAQGVFHAVIPVNLRQSMSNGGGPACLRLRVPLAAEQLAAVHPGVRVTPALLDRLEDWVRRHHRDTLTAEDLADPQLLCESRESLDALSRLLSLGSIYRFQQT